MSHDKEAAVRRWRQRVRSEELSEEDRLKLVLWLIRLMQERVKQSDKQSRGGRS